MSTDNKRPSVVAREMGEAAIAELLEKQKERLTELQQEQDRLNTLLEAPESDLRKYRRVRNDIDQLEKDIKAQEAMMKKIRKVDVRIDKPSACVV